MYKISNMEKTCSITIVTDQQAEQCDIKSLPNRRFLLTKNLNWVHHDIAPNERNLFVDPWAPEGYRWLIVEEGGFPEMAKILKSCEQ